MRYPLTRSSGERSCSCGHPTTEKACPSSLRRWTNRRERLGNLLGINRRILPGFRDTARTEQAS
jgi:hypothetical protein